MEDDPRERPCAALPLPSELAGPLAGYRWSRDLVGESGARVFRLSGKPGAEDLYLKRGSGPVAEDILAEAQRLRWLSGRIEVPAVRSYHEEDGEVWLVTSAIPGRTAYQLLEADTAGRETIVDALAHFLRRWHALDSLTCPFSSDAAGRLALAQARVETGLVDEDDFDPERAGWTAAQVLDAAMESLPRVPDRVVTHGDFSLDNVLFVGGAVAGCIDTGRVGLADPYQDLAIMWNYLGEFGAALQERFLNQYGVVEPDWDRLRFHLLLDELF